MSRITPVFELIRSSCRQSVGCRSTLSEFACCVFWLRSRAARQPHRILHWSCKTATQCPIHLSGSVCTTARLVLLSPSAARQQPRILHWGCTTAIQCHVQLSSPVCTTAPLFCFRPGLHDGHLGSCTGQCPVHLAGLVCTTARWVLLSPWTARQPRPWKGLRNSPSVLERRCKRHRQQC